MRRAPILLALLLASFPLVGQTAEITLWDVPSLVTAKDLSIDISAQSARMAYNQYRSTLAQGLPQVNFTPGYKLQYTPQQELSAYSFTPAPPFISVEDQLNNNQGIHNISAALTVTQLLPTAGNLTLALNQVTSAYTYSSQQLVTAAGTTTSYPSAQFSQQPALTLKLDQPLFVNGKLIDFGLFPATFRQAQLGYLQADQQKRSQTNQSLYQAAQLYLQIVQLRKNIAQVENSIAVAQGNLETLKKNFALGSVAEADLLDARIGVANQRGALLDMRATLSRAERTLSHSLGLPSLEGVSLREDIPTIDFPMTRDAATAKAMGNHPLIQKMNLDAEAKRISDVLAGQSYASSLSLSFSYSPRYPFTSSTSAYVTDFNRSFSDLYGSGSGTDWSLSANLTVHLFDGGKQQADRAASAAAIKLAQDSVAAQQQSVQDNVDIDLMQKANLEEKISVLVDAADLARMRAQTESSLLGLGKSTELEVQGKQADYEAKRNDLWRARADLFLVVIDLNALAGEDLAHIIQGKAQ
jgi:outer membrane protein TolC